MKLSPSQERVKKELVSKMSLIARNCIFLIGKRGVGKTFLM
ncbi:unnamed protein product, partial [marine sediment metagenome]